MRLANKVGEHGLAIMERRLDSTLTKTTVRVTGRCARCGVPSWSPGGELLNVFKASLAAKDFTMRDSWTPNQTSLRHSVIQLASVHRKPQIDLEMPIPHNLSNVTTRVLSAERWQPKDD